MKVKFWGVRGSIPSPGPKTMKVGGNTTCVEICPGGDRQFIIDAGTGIRELGLNMMGRGNVGTVRAHLFMTHTHWDHIHGFPFFVPAFIPGNQLTIVGPVSAKEKTLEQVIKDQMDYEYFPVPLKALGSKIRFEQLEAGNYEFEGVKTRVEYLNHPVTTVGYRFEFEGKTVVTQFDSEQFFNPFDQEQASGGGDDMDDFLFGDADLGPTPESEAYDDKKVHAEADSEVEMQNRKLIDFARDADLVIFDAQYTGEEYPPKKGWGHSTIDDAIHVATEANVKRLAFFHHDPTRTDKMIEEMEDYIKNKLRRMERKDVHIFAAREGMEIDC
ncbi:MBL fold metallo-hydrolase [bacterium]